MIGAARARADEAGALPHQREPGHRGRHRRARRGAASGHLGGAAIDVYPEEPEANGDGFVSPLQGAPNVILTPHIGGSTLEAQANIGREVATSAGALPRRRAPTAGASTSPTSSCRS
jgi:D-3-phosphoglycerate dehydrogenase